MAKRAPHTTVTIETDPLLKRAKELEGQPRPLTRREQRAHELNWNGMRLCAGGCGEWKEIGEENFFKDRDGPEGWSRKCKPCDRKYQNERNQRRRTGEHVVKPRLHYTNSALVQATRGRMKRSLQ